MKNVIFTILLSVLFTLAAVAGTNPVTKVKIFESEKATVSIDSNNEALFRMAIYNPSNDSFVFETEEVISFIQIFNDAGNLEFQLPVMSNKVTISKAIMGSGDYKLGFMIDGQKDVQFTDVAVK